MNAPRHPGPLFAALAGALSLALAVTGCAEKAEPASEASQQAGAAETNAKPAASAEFPCVHFGDLQRHLPKTLEGYRPVRDEGSSGKYGEVSISEAERVFSADEGREISVRIVDTTLVEDLGRAIRAAARDASDRDPQDPTAPILSSEAVGFVRYDHDSQKAEANLLVADRFVVAVSSEGIDGTGEVRRVAEAIDLTGLALLR